MDQLKEILRQAIIYRFWIAVGLSALLPMIAYFVGVGPVQTKAIAETAAIKQADTDAKKYTSGDLPNKDYKPAVQEKTDELSKDVDQSWRKLYARQAPLLTWPTRVHSQFTKWGRKWPADVDSGAVRLVVTDYVEAYPEAVTTVYNSFKPFDPKDGTGIVSAPPEAALLRPASFTIESLPDLGKVWAAQERLWIQRTLLEVVAEVNKSAKNWDGAIIKQVNLVEVGSPAAQDQVSLVKGETLEAAATINDPSKPAEPATTSTDPAGATGMMQMMGGMGSGRAGSEGEAVSYIKVDSDQFKELPVAMVVLIEQDRIQDYLVGLANSPMTIQVKDFEMSKPEVRVTKPQKGENMSFGGMGMGLGGMGAMMSGGMMGYGGNNARMMMGGGASASSGAYSGMMQMQGMMQGGGMGGYGRGSSAPARKGIDKRSEDVGKKRQEEIEKITKAKAASLHDPYFNVVEVKVYGKARFFNPPPAETPAEPSQSQAAATPAADGEKKAEGEAPKTDAAPKADAEKKADAAPKADAEKKADAAPKAEAEKKADAATKPEAEKKAEEEPKADAAKKTEPEKKGAGDSEKKPEEEAKGDAAKKAESPKGEAPKSEGSDPASPKR